MTASKSHATLDTPIGAIHLAASAAGLTHAVYPTRDHGRPSGDGTLEAAAIIAETSRQLREYFAGRRHDFDLPLAPEGTEFQLATWRALQTIPFGETISYADLAARVGRPRAARAVGAANGANPISVIVPCHRVIGKNGTLTGYAGGVDTKQTLLTLEQRAQAAG